MRNKLIPLIAIWLLSSPLAFAQEFHKLHAEHENIIPNPGVTPEYSKPTMVGPIHPKLDVVPKPKPKPKPKPEPPKLIKTGISGTGLKPPMRQQPVAEAPIVKGVLPDQFLGRWQVLGSRSKVVAQPQFQAGIDGIFSGSTSNTWNIQGNAVQGYTLTTDTGVSTALTVQTQGNTAVLRYQHPINKTMAQEALVMELVPGGAQFDGLERISIVKPGEQQPRAQVTYKLVGQRH